ncbi:MAG: adenylyltransferase/cytidyltransferase family protein [Candidatus Paceibacterota bacterium]
MKIIYLYPGTFCPPHYGHVDLARRAAAAFGEIDVVCSVNPVKEEKNIFTPEECKRMWQTYDLGGNIKVMTFDESLAGRGDDDIIVMIRGIRDNNDVIYENAVMVHNRDNLGIMHYHYIIGDKKYEKYSSTAARLAAKTGDMRTLNELVNPQVAALMVEKYRD